MIHLDLFSGIGGFALAAQWARIETIGFVEIDKFCQKVLRKHWPNVPIVEDIHDIEKIKQVVANATSKRCYTRSSDWQRGYLPTDSGIASESKQERDRRFSGIGTVNTNDGPNQRESIPSVNLITGGFPCQPFSVAGKQRGTEDDRYLWPAMLNVIKELQPTWVIGENVAGIINMALDDVLSDLADAGYETQPFVIPACAVNAPHRRDRVWIVAKNTINTGNRRWGHGDTAGGECSLQTKRSNSIITPNSRCFGQEITTEQTTGIKQRSEDATDTSIERLQSGKSICEVQQPTQNFGHNRTIPGWNENWYEVATEFCRVDAGVSNRVDRLKSLGNAIVPQVAFQILKGIVEIEHQK